MPRLSTIKPRLGNVSPRLHSVSRAALEQARHHCRDEVQPWRRWYKTARWQKLRLSVLQRDRYTCQSCGRIEGETSRLVCDHIEPHGGDEEKFWNGPFQTLCKPCHDGIKQAIDRAGKKASFHPYWLRPAKIPVTIICGPPASGKSTYVAAHAAPTDQIIDLDQIAAELSGSSLHGWDAKRWLHPALFKRNDLLGRLSGRPSYPAAWLIVSEPEANWRQWWQDVLCPEQIIVLEMTEAVCVENAARDHDRDMQATTQAIRRWWRRYHRRSGDQVIDIS